ncbi:MAG: sigma factor-like helix-turn-helix DNA-binding protein [Tepidisphaeraceae bacterium]
MPGIAEFQEFFDSTNDSAFHFALHIAGTREAATAACEEAYLRTWRKDCEWSTATGEAHLLALVREESFRRRKPRADTGLFQGVTVDSLCKPMSAIEHALGTLDATSRRALQLAFFGGLGIAAIAEELDEPIAEVRLALRRALLTLASHPLIARHATPSADS